MRLNAVSGGLLVGLFLAVLVVMWQLDSPAGDPRVKALEFGSTDGELGPEGGFEDDNPGEALVAPELEGAQEGSPSAERMLPDMPPAPAPKRVFNAMALTEKGKAYKEYIDSPDYQILESGYLSIYDTRTGYLLERGPFADGMREGHWECFDENTGHVVLSGIYVNDRAEGEWRRWHTNGQLAAITHAVNGKDAGGGRYWSKDGEPARFWMPPEQLDRLGITYKDLGLADE